MILTCAFPFALECNSDCGRCFANPEGQGSRCTKCSRGSTSQYPLGDTCVSECGTGFYLHSSGMCKGK